MVTGCVLTAPDDHYQDHLIRIVRQYQHKVSPRKIEVTVSKVNPEDTPLVDLPPVLCGEGECENAGTNLVLDPDPIEGFVGGQYVLRCPEHTPAPPTLVPPEDAE
jgi:hypothetical protein